MSQRQLEIWSDMVLKYREQRNIALWKTEDETDTWPEHNLQLYRLFKELDPIRPVKLVVINAVAQNADAADILCTDPYPIGAFGKDTAKIDAVAAHADRLEQIIGRDKNKAYTLWLQMYGDKGEKQICPTPRQLKAMSFLAMNHGAKGLSYFCYQPTESHCGWGYRGRDDWDSPTRLGTSWPSSTPRQRKWHLITCSARISRESAWTASASTLPPNSMMAGST